MSITLVFLIIGDAMADNSAIVGWHWYNEQISEKDKEDDKEFDVLYQQFQSLSAKKQLKILQSATDELKDKAILTGNVNDIANFKRAQDFWVTKATEFSVGWDQMLLGHPELNYTLQYSHENALAPIMQQDAHRAQNAAISHLAKENGLMLFYRGDNKGDLMFADVCEHFSKDHPIALLLVSENTPDKSSRFDANHEKANALGVHYFPALMLINPKTGSHQIISYGFMSENEIAERFLQIETNWKPNF